jgi:nucleoid-associated protein YgaU
MAQSEINAAGPPALRRNILLGAAASLVVAGTVAFLLVPRPSHVTGPAPPHPAAVAPQAMASPHSPPTPPAAPAADLPAFDVVRVDPKGSAVFAGRAAPGATVTILDSGMAIGRVTADDHGQFVFLPDTPLPAGGQQLTLSARTLDGVETHSAAALLLLVPDRSPQATNQPPAPVAVLSQPQEAPRLLTPPPAAAPPTPEAQHRRLSLDVVDYDDRGELRFTGSAPASSTVRLYIDNRHAGDSTADAQGRWTQTASPAVAPGAHRLRMDQIDARGQVSARVEMPFQRVSIDPASIGRNRVLVEPGQNLWRLARVVYGSGTRYTIIYRANRDQIRDPRFIYAGQVFAVPAAPGAVGSRPASVAKSR